MSKDPYAALRYSAFRYLISATFLLTVGLLAQEVAIGYELYRITHDPFALAMIGLVEAVSYIAFTLFGGHVADRYNKRTILLWSVGGITFFSVVLQVVMRADAGMPQRLFLAVIYGALFCIGVCRAFQSPAATALRGVLVPPEIIESAATWGSSSWQIGAIIGPVFSGYMYAWIGFANTLLAVTCLAFLSFLLYIGVGDTPVAERDDSEGILSSIGEGIRFVFSTKLILYSISLDLFSVLFGGVVAILPIYAQDILNVGPEGLGILRAASSIGAVAMLLALARFSPMGHPWRNLLSAVMGFGICILVFAVSRNMLLSVVMLFLSGAFDSISVVIRHTILQTMTPDEMRARVMAVNGVFLTSSNELGAVESGVAAKLMGTVPSAVFGGVMTIAIVSWMYFHSKEFFQLNTHRS